jgi:hypothetical protein
MVYPDGTRTANYVQDIRSRSTGPALRLYIQQKYQFSDATMDSINWGAHGKAMRAMIRKRVHLAKLVHECLPTLHRLNKFDDGRRTCPGCSVQREDRDHIIRCQAESRRTWRETFLAKIDKYLDAAETYPLLRHLWRQAITTWMDADGEDSVIMSPVLYHWELRQLIVQQNAIGWRQVINGRFSQEWARIQDDYYARLRTQRGSNDRRSGLTWQKLLITQVWTAWSTLWKLRNEELHGRDTISTERAERQEIKRALKEVYELRPQLEPRVQDLLMRNEQDHMQRPLWVTRNWLAVNAPAIQESARRVKSKAIKGVKSIRSYFAPVR